MKALAIVLILSMALPPWAFAQEPGTKPLFKQEELDQLLAPIALYPDSLLSQILMASTYPLEVVQADRFAKQNKDLKGDALTAALERQEWDPSVKSLLNFPQVLSMMNEKLEWTQKLGDVFLAQQADVMKTVQNLRWKAEGQGNLKTTQEQKIIVEKETKTIIIEPANPQVVYVPVYNPTVVYGSWWWPYYPPYYYYPPGYYAGAALFTFGVGIAFGAAWGYAWGGCNWRHHHVDVNINRNVNINHNINRDRYRHQWESKGYVDRSGKGQWQHSPEHRKGVSYRDQSTAQKFNRGTTNEAARSREAFRGRAEQGRQEISRGSADQFKGREGGSQRSREQVQSRQGTPQGGGTQIQTPQGTQQRSREQVQSRQGSGPRDNAFGSIDQGKADRNFSDRGRSSRESMSTSRGSFGGGSRGDSGGLSNSGPRGGGSGGGQGGGGASHRGGR